ncbi:MAG: hypothetical protein ACYCWW_05020 [Deltaproteobacteria bacterium]
MAAIAGLAVGCGIGPRGNAADAGDGGATDGGGGQYRQYDTLTGNFTAPGISATFSGAMQGNYDPSTAIDPSGKTSWIVLGGFYDPNAQPPAVDVSTPAGDHGTVQIEFTPLGPPSAGSVDCSSAAEGTAIFFSPDGTVPSSYTSGSPCTVTFDGPALIVPDTASGTYNVYFAHGSLTTSMVPNGLSDGGPGTLTASW